MARRVGFTTTLWPYGDGIGLGTRLAAVGAPLFAGGAGTTNNRCSRLAAERRGYRCSARQRSSRREACRWYECGVVRWCELSQRLRVGDCGGGRDALGGVAELSRGMRVGLAVLIGRGDANVLRPLSQRQWPTRANGVLAIGYRSCASSG